MSLIPCPSNLVLKATFILVWQFSVHLAPLVLKLMLKKPTHDGLTDTEN